MASGNGTVQGRQGANGNFQENNVVEIDLAALSVYSFKRWRVLIVMMIVFALLFGGVKAVRIRGEMAAESSAAEELSKNGSGASSSGAALSSDEAESEDTEPDEYKKYKTTKAALEKQVAAATESLGDLKTYMQNSVLYNIDTNEVHRANITYYVKTPYEVAGQMAFSYENSVIAAYISYINSDEFFSNLDSDIDEKYLRELIKAYASDKGYTFTVSIVGDSDEFVHDLMENAEKEIEDKKDTVTADISDHTITVIDQNEFVTSDTSLQNAATYGINVAYAQSSVNDRVSALNNSITNANAQLKNLTEPDESSSGTISKSTALHQIVKYAVIGLLVGIIIFFCYYAVIYAASGRIIDLRKFTSAFRRVNLLGDYYKPMKKGSLAFDRFLAKHDGRRRGEDDYENVMKLSSANLSNILASLGDAGRLLITGTADEKDMENFETTFKSYMENENVKAVSSVARTKNIIADFEGSKALADSDYIVLIESKEKSSISDVSAEIKEISRINKQLAGIIFV